jgi:PAS domain S-box-containing protein
MSNALPQDVSDTRAAPAVGQPTSRSTSGRCPSVPAASPSAAADRRDPRAQQQAVVAVGRRAACAPDLSILTQDAASLIAEGLGVEHSGVAELTPDGSKIIHRLSLHEPGSVEPRVLVRESGPEGTDSLAGYTLEVAYPVSVVELSQDTRFYDPLLQQQGIRSAACIPLKLRGQSFGALLACTRRVHQFDREDMLFVETVAHLVTTTAARVRVEEDFAAERRLAAEVFQTVGAMVLVLDKHGRIVRANRACERITGFSSGEIEDRPIWDVFPVSDEAERFQTTFKRLHQGAPPTEHESQLLTKHSERRQVRWSYSVVRGADQSIESVVATGVDVTAQRQAEQRAAKAETTPAPAGSGSASQQEEEGPERARRGPSTTDTESGLPTSQEELPAKADALPGPIKDERRRRARLAYPYRQRIAPIIDGKLPAKDEFVEVRCKDIAAGGFSFISAKPPQSEVLVVALGTPPKLTYLTAQVAHVTRVQRDGRRVYLVGCSYIGKVAY